MTTIVNTPPAQESGNNTMVLIIGLIIMLVVGYFVVVNGLPMLRNMQLGTPQINVPSEIDVNVKQTK